MVNEQLPWLKPSIQQDQPGLAWRDQINTDERGFLAALTEPAENPESRVEGRMDFSTHRLDTCIVTFSFG